MFKLIVLMAFVISLGCTQTGVSTANHDSKQRTEDYEIYSVVLREMFPASSVTPPIIRSETSAYSLPYSSLNEALERIGPRFEGRLTEDLSNDFSSQNAHPGKLTDLFQIGTKPIILDRDQVRSLITETNGWDRFAERYPGQPLIGFSRVGFNDNRNVALVYTSSQAGGKSGGGYYILLVKKDGQWELSNKLEYWTS